VQDSFLLVDDDDDDGSTLKQGDDKNGNDSSIMVDDDDDDDDDDGQVLPAAAVQRASDNVILVRAELSDFWRLCSMEEEWNICRHYLLYPNPYPKKSRLKSRWYAHPAFPILLQLGGCIVVRSNWKGYLEEFATCAEVANECMGFTYQGDGPTRRQRCKSTTTTTTAWTNFEIKYDSVGEPTYELVLTQQQGRARTFFPEMNSDGNV
jgi:tRNA G46 methylase TrmB